MLHQHHKMNWCRITCWRLGKIFLKHYPHLVVLLQGGPVLTLFLLCMESILRPSRSQRIPIMQAFHEWSGVFSTKSSMHQICCSLQKYLWHQFMLFLIIYINFAITNISLLRYALQYGIVVIRAINIVDLL